jgi:hypothetical protein
LLAVTLACLLAVGTALGAEGAIVRIGVTFLPDGRCAVTGEGEHFRASMTYLPSPAGAAAGLRCAVPDSPKGREVELTVTLPPGAVPAGGEFPRLRWSEHDGRWRGVASLPAAPAFVSVPQGRAAGPARWLDGFAPPTPGSAFGPNFYGWFVFAAVFIGLYFVWARAMAARDGRRVRR